MQKDKFDDAACRVMGRRVATKREMAPPRAPDDKLDKHPGPLTRQRDRKQTRYRIPFRDREAFGDEGLRDLALRSQGRERSVLWTIGLKTQASSSPRTSFTQRNAALAAGTPP